MNPIIFLLGFFVILFIIFFVVSIKLTEKNTRLATIASKFEGDVKSLSATLTDVQNKFKESIQEVSRLSTECAKHERTASQYKIELEELQNSLKTAPDESTSDKEEASTLDRLRAESDAPTTENTDPVESVKPVVTKPGKFPKRKYNRKK